MQHGWLSQAGPYKVEHVVVPRPGGRVDESKPAAGIGHTTEGGLEGSMGVFVKHYAPHFMVGLDRNGKPRIIQMVPLGEMAAAVEHTGWPPTNEWARVQIEIVGKSRQTPWLPDAKTLDVLAALMGTLDRLDVVPMKRPYPDTMPTGTWATPSFARRNDGKWGRFSGWFGHVEIPENSHWDPGALRWSAVIAAAQKYAGHAPTPTPKPRPVARVKVPASRLYWRWLAWRLGEGDFAEYGHANPSVRPVDLPQIVPSTWRKAAADLLRRRNT